ncbi:DUF6777 domain-containing protein [Streptomyces regalis]|uniref:DUF6777 domain-containing protein n=1 Tax=Streptomyces regalis TaxID=68262 RepID=UPI003CC66673
MPCHDRTIGGQHAHPAHAKQPRRGAPAGRSVRVGLRAARDTVDARGVPRMRCACGNPLTAPVAQQGTFKRTGDTTTTSQPASSAGATASPWL